MEALRGKNLSTPPERISAAFAILIGTLWVNIPVLAIMIAAWIALIWIFTQLPESTRVPTFFIPVSFVLGPPLLAWIWCHS